MTHANHHILLIDKDKAHGIQLTAYLEAIGFHVRTVDDESGIAGNLNHTDLIILNTIPRHTTCLKSCRKHKEHPQFIHLPVMMISESIGEDEIFTFYQQGMDDFMARPIQRAEFLGHVHALVRNKRRLDALEKTVFELEQTRKRLEELTVRDDLTGLYNHRYLNALLPREIARSERLAYSFSLVLIDIDNFKSFNDRFGHLNGDIILHEFAARLLSNIRSGDVAMRYGGDEFAVILPGTKTGEAFRIADGLRRLFGQNVFSNQGHFRETKITMSAGISTCPAHATTAEKLLESADRALYSAKRKGRDQIVLAEIAA